MDKQLYRIEDGVRRAKAAWLCGQETILAYINGNDNTLEVPLSDLRSPKGVIEVSGVRGANWGIIYRMTQRKQLLPPIEVIPGSLGTPIKDVEVEADELDLFRQRYSSDS